MSRPMIDREATAELLLEAAEELIRERGAYEISVTDLALACGMSQSNVYRFFDSKEALFDAIAERWFRDFGVAMEAILNADMPVREKLFRFFECRLILKLARYDSDPALFMSYLALGESHHDVVDGYIDLATHHLAVLVSEAMAEGEFAGRAIDEVVGLINLMTIPFCDPHMIVEHRGQATPDNLRRVMDVIFAGLGQPEQARQTLRLAS